MNRNRPPSAALRFPSRFFRICAVFLATAVAAAAQELTPGPTESLMPAAPLGSEQSFSGPVSGFGHNDNPNQVSAYAGAAKADLVQSPFAGGPFVLRPHLNYLYNYSDGIQAAPGQPTTTTVQSIAPGFSLQLGNAWNLVYDPTWKIYSNSAFHDGVDEQVDLTGKVSNGNWVFGFSQSYSQSSDPLIETERQTSVTGYQTSFTASCTPATGPSLDLGLNQEIQLSTETNYYKWYMVQRLHFTVAPRLDLATGVESGFVLNAPGNNYAYFQPQAQISWQLTDKLNLNFVDGLERQFIIRTGGTLNVQIFSAAIAYIPVATTTLTATANRDSASAESVDQMSQPTTYGLQLKQRLLQHFSLSAGVTQQKVSYVETNADLAEVRSDRTDSYTLGLSTALFTRLTVELQFARIENVSTLPGFGFTSNQYGLSVGYSY